LTTSVRLAAPGPLDNDVEEVRGMSLTGIPLILLAAGVTAATLAATVLIWPRWGRWRFLARPVGVLLVEVLLTTTVGLAVNRSQQFYPSWAALFATSDPGETEYHTTAGRLDGWLAGRPDPKEAQTFPWQPAGWAHWHLATPPTVTVPAGYLQHPSWRYSAVLVVADAADAWRVPVLDGPTVLVTVTTTAGTKPATLGVTVPGELGRDLRVTGHRWALVTSAGDDTLARQVVSTGRGRYPSIAFVGTAPPGARSHVVPKTPSKTPSKAKPKAPAVSKIKKVVSKIKKATARITKATARIKAAVKPAGPLPIGVEADYFPVATSVAGPLAAALTWAAAQTPLPLAASAPEPRYLPVQPHRSHPATPGAKRAPGPGWHLPPKPHTTPTPSGGPDGSGQPRP
jgi:hypothetical protein